MRRIPCLAIVAGAALAASACGPEYDFNGSLDELLRSQPERFATVTSDPARYRVQIIYTQVDRDADNRPTFRSYRYRVDAGEYFYPASTVKLPTAVVALEKLNELRLDRDATMLTEAAADFQTTAYRDDTAPNGLPSVGHYVRKIFLVSDNDAYNRLYEFVGQQQLNEALQRRGFVDTRIVHRLEQALDPLQNQHTNPVRFVDGARVLYEQAAVHGGRSFVAPRPELLGVAEIVDGRRVPGPKDFSAKNAFPLQDLHDLLLAVMFPDAVDAARRFALGADDYRFLYRAMSSYAAQSGIPAYADAAAYPPGYVKFLMYGGRAAHIPQRIRIFNKVGDAYGFLTDCAYIVDFERGIEFLLAATIYTNANGTFNDDDYEYDDIGLPFLESLGQAIYEVEQGRERPNTPDLSRYRVRE